MLWAAFSQVLTISLACLHCHFACRVLSRTLNHLKRKPPPSLVVSLLEKTRAKFLFSSKCLLKSSAHTCQHWMQCTLVAWLLLCVCVVSDCERHTQTLHVHVPSCSMDKDMCITCRGRGHTLRKHKTTPAPYSLCLHPLELKNIPYSVSQPFPGIWFDWVPRSALGISSRLYWGTG